MKKLLVKGFTAKNIKTGFGHDLAGAYCDVYLNNKKMFYFNDDGYGGEADIEFFKPEYDGIVKVLLEKDNYAQRMFENGWKFMKSVDKIDFHTQCVNLAESLINVKEEEKAQRKIKKYCEKSIVFGNDYSMRTIGFKITLREIVETHKEKGVEAIQKAYDRAKSQMKEGDRILNENLEEFGIKL